MSKLYIQMFIAMFAIIVSMLSLIAIAVIRLAVHAQLKTSDKLMGDYTERVTKATNLLKVAQQAYQAGLLQVDRFEGDLNAEQRRIIDELKDSCF